MDIQPDTGRVPQWTFGDRLRKAREGMGLDRAEFAALGEPGDFSYKMIANYEQGITLPKTYAMRELAKMAGVNFTWLTTGNAPSDGGPDGGIPSNVVKLPGLDSNQEPIGEQNLPNNSTFRTWGISERDLTKAA